MALITSSFVLGPLLGRRDLDKRAQEALDHAFKWLGTHGDKSEAEFVLNPLLGRKDLGERAQGAIDCAFKWLARHGDKPDAEFVLSPLLGRKDLGERAQGAIDCAFKWLAAHGDNPDAQFLLGPLLGRTDVGERAQSAIGHALKWLGTHGERQDAQFLLNPLLGRTDLGERSQSAIGHALKWLGTHGERQDAQFLLNPLLGRTDLGERSQSAIDCAFKWLAAHGQAGRSIRVQSYLAETGLPDSDWEKVATLAIGWLDCTPDNQLDRDYTLYSLLARPERLTAEAGGKLAMHSVNWLRGHSAETCADRMPAALRKLRRTLPKHHPMRAEITHVMEAILLRRSHPCRFPESRALPEQGIEADLSTSRFAILEKGCVAVQSHAKLSPASAGSPSLPCWF